MRDVAVTGVQTWLFRSAAEALPALGSEAPAPPPPTTVEPAHERGIFGLGRAFKSARRALSWDKPDSTVALPAVELPRSEERRGGKEGRTRWPADRENDA